MTTNKFEGFVSKSVTKLWKIGEIYTSKITDVDINESIRVTIRLESGLERLYSTNPRSMIILTKHLRKLGYNITDDNKTIALALNDLAKTRPFVHYTVNVEKGWIEDFVGKMKEQE